jgi:hypothetical protein
MPHLLIAVVACFDKLATGGGCRTTGRGTVLPLLGICREVCAPWSEKTRARVASVQTERKDGMTIFFIGLESFEGGRPQADNLAKRE